MGIQPMEKNGPRSIKRRDDGVEMGSYFCLVSLLENHRIIVRINYDL